MRHDVLVAEISGKRPGGVRERPTEKNKCSYDHLIISNNSDGYDTEWPLVNVPADYMEWYKSEVKTSESAWYAPMNRSYAIKYAREHGYRYLVQLDDNITFLEISYFQKKDEQMTAKYRTQSTDGLLDDFIEMFITVLENTNAGMVGCGMAGASCPDNSYLAERYVYSCFALDLERCPDTFQGDFEDDIEFRLKMAQMGIPVVAVAPLKYSKTGQDRTKDLTGNRKAYAQAGVLRCEHMRKLYGDIYSCGMRSRSNSIMAKNLYGEAYFKHIIKPFKVGVLVKDQTVIDEKMAELFRKWAKPRNCKTRIREKKVQHGKAAKRDRPETI